MNTLVVGGTGMIGGYIALGLRDEGHDVTVSARKPAAADTPLGGFAFLPGDYVDEDFTRDQLSKFDTIVFTACKDVREAPSKDGRAAEEAFYKKANSEGVPKFFALARDAGVRRAAYIGSFYPQVVPELIKDNLYIKSRLEADEGARALASEDFHIVSLNAPWVIGALPGSTNALCTAFAQWGLGRLPVPLHAASGGTNFISLQSLYEAVLGGLTKGENGRGYLVGDENLHFADFFKLFFEAAGRPAEFTIQNDEPMALLPDRALFTGRTGTIFYQPEGVAELGYRQKDMARSVREIVDLVRN